MNEKKNKKPDENMNQSVHINRIKKELADREIPRNRGGFQERRRQADWVVNAASVFSLISWIVALASWVVIDFAAPDTRMAGVSGTLGYNTQSEWTVTLLPTVLILLVFSVLSCIAAFIFNMMRMRRKTDKYRKSIIIIGTISIAGLIVFVLRFSEYLF